MIDLNIKIFIIYQTWRQDPHKCFIFGIVFVLLEMKEVVICRMFEQFIHYFISFGFVSLLYLRARAIKLWRFLLSPCGFAIMLEFIIH